MFLALSFQLSVSLQVICGKNLNHVVVSQSQIIIKRYIMLPILPGIMSLRCVSGVSQPLVQLSIKAQSSRINAFVYSGSYRDESAAIFFNPLVVSPHNNLQISYDARMTFLSSSISLARLRRGKQQFYHDHSDREFKLWGSLTLSSKEIEELGKLKNIRTQLLTEVPELHTKHSPKSGTPHEITKTDRLQFMMNVLFQQSRRLNDSESEATHIAMSVLHRAQKVIIDAQPLPELEYDGCI